MPIIPQASLARPQAQSRGAFNPIATLADLENLKAASLRRRAADVEVQGVEDQQRRQAALQAELRTLDGKPRQMIAALRRHGFIEEADKAEKHVSDQIAAGIKQEAEQTELWKSQLTVGRQLLNAVRESPNPELTYSQVAPMLRGLAGEELGQIIPEQYDAEALAMLDAAVTDADTYTDQRIEAREAFEAGDGLRATALTLTLSKTPEQWQQALDRAEGLGAITPEQAATFGEFSPENLAKAEQLTLSPEKQADLKADAQSEARLTAQLAETIRHNRATEGNEPLVAVMGPDGKPVYVPRRQAVGKQPVAGSRGGTRPVTSGDANRLSELQTSLDDVVVLTEALKGAGTTGTISQIGAMMPNWVTEMTGWGQDAKSKQAVIDRVKQVIGRALEGGVLRKEDEEKYKKILPTIGDPVSVVQTKLQGLEAAIEQRYQRQLEALEDAGYDTSGFRARGEGGAGDQGGGAVQVQGRDGKTYEFPDQAAADAFKRAGG